MGHKSSAFWEQNHLVSLTSWLESSERLVSCWRALVCELVPRCVDLAQWNQHFNATTTNKTDTVQCTVTFLIFLPKKDVSDKVPHRVLDHERIQRVMKNVGSEPELQPDRRTIMQCWLTSGSINPFSSICLTN